MIFEVEQKFRVDTLDPVAEKLQRMDADFQGVVEQVDCYFAHPARDFAQTDEALRIRRVGDDCYVTYKGPKVDETTKTRREIELPLPSGGETVSQYTVLLEQLGFQRVAEVRKQRCKVAVAWQGSEVEAALDSVDDVGQFVELELSVSEVDVESAKQCVAALAQELGLSTNERRSYLQLLLDGR